MHILSHLDVRAIWSKLKMSQNAFAARFGILPFTWRDGNRIGAIPTEQRASY
jgi:DNA-binding transcriptional regulator YiaG